MGGLSTTKLKGIQKELEAAAAARAKVEGRVSELQNAVAVLTAENSTVEAKLEKESRAREKAQVMSRVNPNSRHRYR